MRKLFPYFLSAVVTASFSQLASAQGVSTQQAGDQNERAQSGEPEQKQKQKRNADSKRPRSDAQGRSGPSTQQSGDQNETAQSGDRSAGGGSSARNPSPVTPLPR
jgi:hypothetical protein